MIISYSKLFVGISLPTLCTGLASLLLSISADAQTIRPTTQKELKVFDPTTGNSGNIGIRAAAGTLSYTLTMPAARPTANQVLSASAVTGGNVSLTWATPVSGTVTSVGISVPTGFSVSSSPVTSAGTLSLSYASGYALPTTASQTNWDGAFYDRITAASVTGTTTKTITLTQQDGGTVTATFSDLNTDAVTSVFGRTGAVTATTGDYTTAQVTESGNLYYTDARARAAISLTTTGSSGAATYSSTSGVLNIPTYTLSGLGAIGGNGTTNYVSKFATAGTLTNSLIFDNGTSVGIGTASPNFSLDVEGTINAKERYRLNNYALAFWNTDAQNIQVGSAVVELGYAGSALKSDFATRINANSSSYFQTFNNGTTTFFNFVGGNVGIGTITPTARLEIRGAGTTSATTALEVDNSISSPLLVVRNDGNVGIGTTSPGFKLQTDLVDDFTYTGQETTRALPSGVVALFKNNTTTGGTFGGIGLQTRYDRQAYIGAIDEGGTFTPAIVFGQRTGSTTFAERMRIDLNGNVGIGTASPALKLHISGTTGYPATSGTTQTGIARFESISNSNVLDIGQGNSGAYGLWLQGTGRGNLSLAYPILLNPNGGNVGIGTTNPTSMVDGNNSAINNDWQFSLPGTMRPDPSGTHLAVRSISNEAVLNLHGSQTNDNGKISGVYFSRIGGQADAHINVASIQARLAASGNAPLGGGQLWFFTKPANTSVAANSPQMVLNASGNVGIGTTSPQNLLHVQGNQIIATASGGIRFTGTDGVTNNIELRYEDSSSPSLSVRDNGTATDRVTFLQSGNVGIGTTSPDHKLDIEDSVNSSLITKVRNLHSSSSASSILRVGNNTLENLLDISGWSSGYTETVVRKRNGVSLEANGAGGLSISAGTLSGVIRLFTGGQAASNQRLTILSDGKVSVGDSDPIGRFEVKAGSDDVEVLEIEDENESTLFRVSKTGVVRIPKLGSSSNTAVRINTDGTLTTSTSDARLKKNIQVIPNALQKVMGLRGVTYNWKDGRDTTRVLGMIAQEMLKVAPELVFQNNNGYYGIHYAETTGLLVEAIKEQQKIIEELKKTQALMAGQLRQLQADLIKKEDRGVSTAPNQ